MALGENEGMNTTMLVSPAAGYAQPYGGGIGGMGLGSDWGSLIILFLLFGMFGNGGFGGGFGGYGNSEFPSSGTVRTESTRTSQTDFRTHSFPTASHQYVTASAA